MHARIDTHVYTHTHTHAHTHTHTHPHPHPPTSTPQVLKLLPVATLAQQLPRITRIIATSCADKDEDVRTGARKTIASVAVVLGVRFLPYLMGELRSTLVWGYQVICPPPPLSLSS